MDQDTIKWFWTQAWGYTRKNQCSGFTQMLPMTLLNWCSRLHTNRFTQRILEIPKPDGENLHGPRLSRNTPTAAVSRTAAAFKQLPQRRTLKGQPQRNPSLTHGNVHCSSVDTRGVVQVTGPCFRACFSTWQPLGSAMTVNRMLVLYMQLMLEAMQSCCDDMEKRCTRRY